MSNTVTPAATPNLADYDVILLNTSGGKDSQVTVHRVAVLAHLTGVADRLLAVHADLGEMEWHGTRTLAEEQVAYYGDMLGFTIPIEVVRRDVKGVGVQTLLEQVEARGMWPDAARRYCTSDHKRAPIRKVMTALADDVRASGVTDRPVRILNVMGMRAQESKSRAAKAPYRHDPSASNGRRHVDEWLPLHEWTEFEVWEDIKSSGAPYHPAYDAGMPRLSCRFCVLASKDALVLSAQLNPELAQEYLAVEQKIGHTFRQDLSMAQIIAEAQARPPVTSVPDWNT